MKVSFVYFKCTFLGLIVKFLSSAKLSGLDTLEVSVYGNEERILLVSRFDNLGKGASGAAIQNMNLVLGVPEDTGLCV